MKLTKFMCAAFAAMVAFAGCQKDETPAQESKNFKSVEVSINNVFPSTKAIGGVGDLEGKNVQLNSLQFFFSDGTTLYEAKDVDGATISLPETEILSSVEDCKSSSPLMVSFNKEDTCTKFLPSPLNSTTPSVP